MNLLPRIILVLLAGTVVFAGCRRRAKPVDPTAAPTPEGAVAAEASATAAPRTYLAPPPSTAPLPTDEAHRFNAPEPMNMYSPAGPGDYQAQLNAYNRVLRKWSEGADVPATFHDLMATYNSPKPPQPPAGRRLVYDPKTVSVRLQ